ncbi:MAG: hypothetical protein WCD89_11390 [Anaerocolumna sp.]
MREKFKFLVPILALALTIVFMGNSLVSSAATSLLPVGGDEYDYEPEEWNDTATLRSNCYTYAVLKLCSTEEKFKIQPGWLAGEEFSTISETSIINAVKKDLKVGGIIEKDIYETNKNTVPPDGYRKIALVIAPGVDYHWYEQNSDGYWSHKPGTSDVTDVDASGNYIVDPATCDRHYVYVYRNWTGTYKTVIDYTQFCGYYMIEV